MQKPAHSRARSRVVACAGALALCCALSGCELIASFDRGKIPSTKADGGARDASSAMPHPDAGDSTPDNDGG